TPGSHARTPLAGAPRRARARGSPLTLTSIRRASDGQVRLTLDEALLEPGALACTPPLNGVNDAISQGSAIGAQDLSDGTRDADELDCKPFGLRSHDGIAVATHVDEFEMGRVVGVGQGPRCREVAGARIFERAANAALEREIDRGFIPRVLPLDGEQWPERMALQSMLKRLCQTGRRNGPADERDPHGLEGQERKALCRVPGPEAVPVPRNRDEPLDPLVADELVQLGALAITRAQVSRDKRGITRSRPCGLCQTPGQVLRI